MSGVVIVGAGLAGSRCAERLSSEWLRGSDPADRRRARRLLTAGPRFQRSSSPAMSASAISVSGARTGGRSRGSSSRSAAESSRSTRSAGSVTLQGGSETQLERPGGRHRLARATLPRPSPCARRPHPAVASGRPRPHERSRPGRRLVVVGAGFLGTEVASTANALGVAVTFVDPSPPLSRVLGDEIARFSRPLSRPRDRPSGGVTSTGST